jgi:hypothetical protein
MPYRELVASGVSAKECVTVISLLGDVSAPLDRFEVN